MTIEQFIEVFNKCYSPVKDGYVEMDWTPKYQEILTSINEHRHTIILKKTRQTGLTNIMMLYAAYTLITGENKTIMYVSNKYVISTYFITRLKNWLTEYGFDDLFTGKNNKNQLDVGTNTIIVTSATEDSMRGYSVDLLLVDEAAYINKLRDFLSASMVGLMPESRIVIGSSPNGYEYFQTLWLLDNFNKHSLHWSDTTRFDKEWYEEMKRGYYNTKKFRQELDGEFFDVNTDKTKTISLRVSKNLYNQIDRRLLVTGESTSDYLRRLIEEDINSHR
jgi:hypothetical protein